MNKKLLLGLTTLPLLCGCGNVSVEPTPVNVSVEQTPINVVIQGDETKTEETDWLEVNYFRGETISNLKRYRKLTSDIYELEYEYSSNTSKTYTSEETYSNKNIYGTGTSYSYGTQVNYTNYSQDVSYYTFTYNQSTTLTWTRYYKEINNSGYYLNETISTGYASSWLNELKTEELNMFSELVEDYENVKEYCNDINNYDSKNISGVKPVVSNNYSLASTVNNIKLIHHTYTANYQEETYPEYPTEDPYTRVISTSNQNSELVYEETIEATYKETQTGFKINTYLGK